MKGAAPVIIAISNPNNKPPSAATEVSNKVYRRLIEFDIKKLALGAEFKKIVQTKKASFGKTGFKNIYEVVKQILFS